MEEQDTTQVEETDVNEEPLPSEETEETAELEQEESGESSEDENEEDNLEEKPKKVNRVQQRISELTAEKKFAKMEAEFYRRQYEEGQRPQTKPQEPQQAPTPPGLPPDRYDFDNDEQFQTAIGKYQENSVNYQRHLVREEINADRNQQQQGGTLKLSEMRFLSRTRKYSHV